MAVTFFSGRRRSSRRGSRLEEDCAGPRSIALLGAEPLALNAAVRVWTEGDGFLFECAECGHQTSLTSALDRENAAKFFNTRFREFEISTRRTGIRR